MTEGGAGPESLPLGPAASSRLTNRRARPASWRHGRGRLEAQGASDQPVGLGDGWPHRALEQTATADPRPLSGSSRGLSRVSLAGWWRRCSQRAQRATAASAADLSTRTSCAGRAASAGPEPDPTSRRRLADRRWRITPCRGLGPSRALPAWRRARRRRARPRPTSRPATTWSTRRLRRHRGPRGRRSAPPHHPRPPPARSADLWHEPRHRRVPHEPVPARWPA
jgi:hypothetical protein